ncbi:DUF5641 domain-containing protein, partial [Trichonephila clavipes]
SRVAPLKLLSIPCLELMACCVGARLVNSILKALNMPDLKVTLWCDSTTALGWIKEYGNWSVFVANRVKEIRQLTQIQSWKYVPGNMNIADLLSRGCSPRQILSSRWWEGPSWLKQNSEYWPDGEISCEPQEVNVERKKTKNANVDLANDAPPLLICNVSDYDKMIRVFAWILRFVNNCRKDYNKCKEHELSIAEIENSEKQLIRLSQTYYLPDVESLKFVTFIDNDNILRELIPLTPAMFLIENRCSDTTDIDELNSRDLRKRMKYRIKLLSDLRQRFRKEYLSELIQKQNDNRVREPRIGEMVLIGNDNKKRLSWPIAKIIELIRDRDGEIRIVRLKTQHGTVIRPVQRIFPLKRFNHEWLRGTTRADDRYLSLCAQRNSTATRLNSGPPPSRFQEVCIKINLELKVVVFMRGDQPFPSRSRHAIGGNVCSGRVNMSTERVINGGLFSLRMSPGSVCVGICLGERTDSHVFYHGNVYAHTYRDDILDTYVCPYADATGDAFVLQDDNARPHRARIVDTYLEQEAIQRVPGSRQPLTKDLKEEGRFNLSTFRSIRKYFIDHAKTILFE